MHVVDFDTWIAHGADGDGNAARQGSRGARCRRSGTRTFRAGGVRPRDLADDRAVSRVVPRPRRCFLARRCGARMAGTAMAVKAERGIGDQTRSRAF
jgi:hypothetical protein